MGTCISSARTSYYRVYNDVIDDEFDDEVTQPPLSHFASSPSSDSSEDSIHVVELTDVPNLLADR